MSLAPFTIRADFWPESLIGTIWSASPWRDECRHVELLEILREVRLRERLDALIGIEYPALHAPQIERVQDSIRDLSPGQVGPVELDREILIKLSPICDEACPDPIEDLYR